MYTFLRVHRCDELVNGYVMDTDPEARLQVEADMRKIQLCFQLLKVMIMIATPYCLVTPLCVYLFLCRI